MWTTILTDPDLDNLSLDDLGRWCKLLLYVKMHGKNGTLCITEPAKTFCHHMQVSCVSDFINIAERLPNVLVKCNDENGVTLIITVKKWSKYQVDDSRGRVARYRQNVTPQDKDKDKNKNKNKIKNKNKNILSSLLKKEKIIYIPKHKFGKYQNVLLSEDELKKLQQKFGPEDASKHIDTLSEGLELKGYKYKSHYLAILKWAENQQQKRSEYL